MGIFRSIFGTYSSRQLKKIQPLLDRVNALEPAMMEKSDEQLREQTDKFREKLSMGESLDNFLPEAYATVREAARRVIGQRHHDVQIIGGIVLHQGRIAEMATGEGKTLAATLPAYLNALTGNGVHVVTVNEYLARYQAEWMGRIYKFLGLTVGIIVHGQTNPEKKAAYACDITYGTNNEFGFDYLRDNMAVYKSTVMQRGHAFAVVDEVDSILIDEARTPLIISGAGDEATDLYVKADKFVRGLKKLVVKEMDNSVDHEAGDDDQPLAVAMRSVRAERIQDINSYDYVVDEKAKTVTLTSSGVEKAEKFFELENFSDPENSEINHHINQAMRAHGIMKLDVDYVIQEGKIVIVDEFTGRIMPGRRYSNGLHQAIEAKERLVVQKESKTLATITFQNYFRLYKKLSGMTGTALTEQEEFMDIYKLDVVAIPTDRPMIRNDLPDFVYKTEAGKFAAVCDTIEELHKKGQPVLAGTISVEKSELLSKMLKKRGVPHVVLNAKQHAKEAQIVAQAGAYGAVTISTNMAGRGTDIILGGNPEFLAREELEKKNYTPEQIELATSIFEPQDEESRAAQEFYTAKLKEYREKMAPEAERVRSLGGLFIIGTERHESRRIDNQLRGRAGRQGDPGASRFFLSLEDDLMRLFGSDRLSSLVERLGMDDTMALDQKIVSGAIESAQKRVEARNFESRKNVLKYDDVLNEQRKIIYEQRRQVLDGEDIKPTIMKMMEDYIKTSVDAISGDADPDDWNFAQLKESVGGVFIESEKLDFDVSAFETLDKNSLSEMIFLSASNRYEAKEQEIEPARMRELERIVLLQTVDKYWIEHIDAMDDFRKGIYLRAYSQRDPVLEYRREGYLMFDGMIAYIKEITVKMLLSIRVRKEETLERKQVARPGELSAAGAEASAKAPVRKKTKIGPNDPCPCGSGKKYKKCCGFNQR